MSKTLPEVISEQYPDLPQYIYGVVGWKNDTHWFDIRSWPYHIYATAPTQEQLDIWMA